MLNLILLGEVIQIHFTAPCGKEKFPNCYETYKSPEAYKCKVKYHSNYILFILNMSFFFKWVFFLLCTILSKYACCGFEKWKIHFHYLHFLIVLILGIFFNLTLLMVIYQKQFQIRAVMSLFTVKRG